MRLRRPVAEGNHTEIDFVDLSPEGNTVSESQESQVRPVILCAASSQSIVTPKPADVLGMLDNSLFD